jgi:hypothetical protein
MADQTKERVDCLVLSGGGAKGAYGAGVAKALFEYRKLKKINTGLCFVGTSAGALNASVLAQYGSTDTTGADALIKLWRSLDNHKVLGVRITNVKFRTIVGVCLRKSPFSVYPNEALGKLIKSSVQFDKLQDKHLIIAVTDYTAGNLKAFYVSSAMEKFIYGYNGKLGDAQLQLAQRRLGHCAKIDNQDMLVSSLLASSAIPLFFPPVKIGNNWHIDGGVGNHTPTREAAYFLRFLEEYDLGGAGEVYCVKQDPPRIIEEGQQEFRSLGIIKRTLEVYHYVHTEPIITAWGQINASVRANDKKIQAFTKWVSDQTNISDPVKAEICKRIDSELGKSGGHAPQLTIPIVLVEPSSSLGDSVDFDKKKIDENIKMGYIDFVKVLSSGHYIDDAEKKKLLALPLW